MESMQFYDRLKMIIRGCQHGWVKTPQLKSLTLVTHRATNTIQYNAITYCCQNQSKTGRLKPPDMSITALTPLLCAYLMSSQPGPHHVSQTSYCPPSYNYDTFVHCARAVATEETVFSITSSAMHSDDGFNRPTSFALLPGTGPASDTRLSVVSRVPWTRSSYAEVFTALCNAVNLGILIPTAQPSFWLLFTGRELSLTLWSCFYQPVNRKNPVFYCHLKFKKM